MPRRIEVTRAEDAKQNGVQLSGRIDNEETGCTKDRDFVALCRARSSPSNGNCGDAGVVAPMYGQYGAGSHDVMERPKVMTGPKFRSRSDKKDKQ